MDGKNILMCFSAIYLLSEVSLGRTLNVFDLSEEPIHESEDIESDDQAVKDLINSLNLNEKVEIDGKNPKLKELKEKIEEMLKKKKKEMKEQEEKKSDDKVVNLKPKKDEKCSKVEDDKEEPKEKQD